MPEAPESKIRARAGAIGFSGKAADTLVKSLSGGEKARLLLGLATFFGPNMIILDEPTNHLDIDSRAALAEAINEFPGAVIMVSHDRYLIEACADRLWVLADHAVANFDGDLDDYRRLVLSSRDERAPREAAERAIVRDRPARAERQKPARQRIADAEAEIERITAIIAKIDAALGRIEDGSYGYCEDTGEPIGLKRLDARPIATLSVEAQERHERRERVYREE